MAGEAHTFTAEGNMRAPPRRDIVKWILAAWYSLNKTMIINSFKSCALTTVVGGSGPSTFTPSRKISLAVQG